MTETPDQPPQFADMLQQCLNDMEPIVIRLATEDVTSTDELQLHQELLAQCAGAVILMARAWISIEQAGAQTQQADTNIIDINRQRP